MMLRFSTLILFVASFSACKSIYKPIDRAEVSTLSATVGESGNAVHYPAKDEGALTASGEQYQHGGLTAAHRTLPFGTVLTVFNVENGKKTQVRINDRFEGQSKDVILLSGAAAQDLGMLVKGRAQVQLYEGVLAAAPTAQALSANRETLAPITPVISATRPVVSGRSALPDQQLQIYNAANAPVASAVVNYPPQANPYPTNPYPNPPSPVLNPYPVQPSNPNPSNASLNPYPIQPSNPVYTTPVNPPSLPAPVLSQPVANLPVAPTESPIYTIQAIVHGTKAKADQAIRALGNDAWMQEIMKDGQKMYRILYGHYRDRGSAEAAKTQVRRTYREAIIRSMSDL